MCDAHVCTHVLSHTHAHRLQSQLRLRAQPSQSVEARAVTHSTEPSESAVSPGPSPAESAATEPVAPEGAGRSWHWSGLTRYQPGQGTVLQSLSSKTRGDLGHPRVGCTGQLHPAEVDWGAVVSRETLSTTMQPEGIFGGPMIPPPLCSATNGLCHRCDCLPIHEGFTPTHGREPCQVTHAQELTLGNWGCAMFHFINEEK